MITKRGLGAFIFILIIIIALSNFIANEYFLYWRFWWLDIIMHFLGGLWVSLTSLWLYYFSGIIKKPKIDNTVIFLISLISALSIGIGWEIFEFLLGMNHSFDYWSDTFCDIGMDVVGSLIAFQSFYYMRLKNYYLNFKKKI